MNYGVVLPIWQLTIARGRIPGDPRRGRWASTAVFVPESHPGQAGHDEALRRHWPDPFSAPAFWPGARGASAAAQRDRAALPNALVTGEGGGHGRPGIRAAAHLRRRRGLGRGRVHRLRLPFRERVG